MRKILVHKAQRVRDEVEDLEIVIGGYAGEFPDYSRPDGEVLFDADAYILAKALRDHLPGGTLDRLIVELLTFKRSQLRVAQKKTEAT